MTNELKHTSGSGRKYLLRLADIWVKQSSWIEVTDITDGKGEDPKHINIIDEDQQDFRQGTSFAGFMKGNPELESVITGALKKAAEQLP